MDLRNLFLLNNPLGSPSNAITLVDHFNVYTLAQVGITGILLGDMVPTPLTTTIIGNEAHYTFQIQFRALEAIL